MSCRIARIGIAPFGITMCPIISLIFMNRACVAIGGEKALTAFACTSYVLSVVFLLLQGVGDGSQPLMSEAFGKEDRKALRGFFKDDPCYRGAG